MTPITFHFYYFGILLEYRANFRHRNQKISLGDTVKVTISPEIMDVRARILNYTIFRAAKFHYIQKKKFLKIEIIFKNTKKFKSHSVKITFIYVFPILKWIVSRSI